MTARWARPSIVLGILLALLAGCTSHQEPTPAAAPSQSGARPPSGLDAEGAEAWERWQSQEVHDYRYRLVVMCFCPSVDDVVVVTDDEVSTVGGQPYRAQRVTGFADAPPTIDGLFEELATAMADADDVSVRYDPETGVPTSVRVDWMTNAIDDEISYRTSDLIETGPGTD